MLNPDKLYDVLGWLISAAVTSFFVLLCDEGEVFPWLIAVAIGTVAFIQAFNLWVKRAIDINAWNNGVSVYTGTAWNKVRVNWDGSVRYEAHNVMADREDHRLFETWNPDVV